MNIITDNNFLRVGMKCLFGGVNYFPRRAMLWDIESGVRRPPFQDNQVLFCLMPLACNPTPGSEELLRYLLRVDYFLYKKDPYSEWETIVDRGMQSGPVWNKTKPEEITERQLDVVFYLAKGGSFYSCARFFNISKKAVSANKRSVMAMLGVSSDMALYRIIRASADIPVMGRIPIPPVGKDAQHG